MTVCRNFALALERIIQSKPDHLVSLFLARLPKEAAPDAARAMKAGHRYIRLRARAFVPVVALCWPVHETADFLEFTRTARLATKRSDDAAVWQWMARRRKTVWVALPSLVEHPDMVPSTIGRRAHWGEDSGRVALFPIGDQDPLEFQW